MESTLDKASKEFNEQRQRVILYPLILVVIGWPIYFMFFKGDFYYLRLLSMVTLIAVGSMLWFYLSRAGWHSMKSIRDLPDREKRVYLIKYFEERSSLHATIIQIAVTFFIITCIFYLIDLKSFSDFAFEDLLAPATQAAFVTAGLYLFVFRGQQEVDKTILKQLQKEAKPKSA